MDDRLKEIDRLLKKQCWLIDVLPEQVPADAGGCFFEVEQFWLGDGESVCRGYFEADVLLPYCSAG